MIRPAHVWIAFLAYIAVALTTMAWVSSTARHYENANQEARAREQFEDRVRLALWRMDSAVTPILARESARPYFHYRALYPAQQAYTQLFATIGKGEVQVPSPLLTIEPAFLKLHFSFDGNGELTSPQVPTGNSLDVAEMRHVSSDRVQTYRERLETFVSRVSADEIRRTLGETPSPAAFACVPMLPLDIKAPELPEPQQVAMTEQKERGRSEWIARNNFRTEVMSNGLLPSVVEGRMRPVWVGDELVFVRTVTIGDEQLLQGAWVDWEELREWLRGSVAELFPDVTLTASIPDEQGVDRQLASLPVRVEPGATESVAPLPPSAIRLSLGAAWACFLIASLAVALLLHGAVALSERRGAFASSVTHELRTPLTTFKMYTEMLSEGMVTDEKKREEYLATLRHEAHRLGHLVENVLTYSRLERGSSGRQLETVTIDTLLARIHDRIEERARQTGMQIVVDDRRSKPDASLDVDPSAVEQIVFNLVDNACKYAASADDRRIHLVVEDGAKNVRITVRDHGDGIERADERHLFRPFRKGRRHRSMHVPGIGLGLALSRQLARTMRGNLGYERSDRGAAFVLELPTTSR